MPARNSAIEGRWAWQFERLSGRTSEFCQTTQWTQQQITRQPTHLKDMQHRWAHGALRSGPLQGTPCMKSLCGYTTIGHRVGGWIIYKTKRKSIGITEADDSGELRVLCALCCLTCSHVEVVSYCISLLAKQQKTPRSGRCPAAYRKFEAAGEHKNHNARSFWSRHTHALHVSSKCGGLKLIWILCRAGNELCSACSVLRGLVDWMIRTFVRFLLDGDLCMLACNR